MDQENVTKLSISLQGMQRNYQLFSSPGNGSGGPFPLVIMLHGGGSSPELVLEKYDWTAKAASEGFLLALPEAAVAFPGKPASFRRNPRGWNEGSNLIYPGGVTSNDIGFIAAMIDELGFRFNIDQYRVFIAGFSNGASMALRTGIELSDRIAAVGAVSGHLKIDKKSSRPVPLIYIGGSADPNNPPGGGYSALPWGLRVYKPPVQQTLDKWIHLNGCDAIPEVLQDRKGIKKVLYKSGGCEVLYIEVEGLGHVWPGGAQELPRNIAGPPSDLLNGTDVIWDFFKNHPRPCLT